jgi:hypothetical protein
MAEEIDKILHQLSKRMYGYNYQVTFLSNVFNDCPDINTCVQQLKVVYPGTYSKVAFPVATDIQDFWDHVNEGLDYRGDQGAGLILSEKKEEELKVLQSTYKDYIGTFIQPTTKIYAYSYEGLPAYPVFWDYTFFVLTDRQDCLFIHGSASD